MSDQVKKSTVGDPIWVESIASPADYRIAAGMFPSTFPKGSSAPLYNPNIHKGGTWRDGMGASLSKDEIVNYNKGLELLHKLMHTKTFQHRPEYGTHAEAKP